MAQSSAAASLRPVTPASSTRYDSSRRELHAPRMPSSSLGALRTRPAYLPPSWVTHVNPEGAVYYVRSYSGIAVVTPACEDMIDRWSQIERGIGAAYAAQGFVCEGRGHLELYIELEEGTDTCGYYFVNHETRAPFWIEDDLHADELQLPAFASISTIRLALEEQYWLHAERFPSHRPQRLSLRIPELISVFLHAKADQLTSNQSTFPFNAHITQQLIDLLGILQAKHGDLNGHDVGFVARLWARITRYRYESFYGESHSRSREQRILEHAPGYVELAWSFLVTLLFNIPEHYKMSLDGLWIDDLVSESRFRNFMAESLEEWKSFGISLSLTLLS
ncbi:hypothetical protein CERSUDRAFT_84754 [Gelatoporia subvermispora B]|uniref:WW domain-containing protein n=1 Tax=Ceriporiopsis subvermispora (strain B) TaxID=914234 RepID=M2RCQ4_CERS8|nr:hypothetical protein CERSUDRAFT_84754 [Gelatoporia subvermispora B]